MAKNLLQDMVKRKTIREIKIPERVKASVPPVSQPEPVVVPPPIKVSEPIKIPELVEIPEPAQVPFPSVKVNKLESVNYESDKYSSFETKFASVNDAGGSGAVKNKSRYALWMVALASAAFLVFALSFLFSDAKITVNPKTVDLTSNVNLSAVKDGGQGDLPYNLIVISGQESQTVTAGAVKDVSIPAKGTVVIYNAFNSVPQALAIDTRLEGSNGKIYKTSIKTTVPGMTGSIPGSVEVGIYAAELGAASNSSPLDFKIFGFKGTPKYEKFYARSKGDLTGGLVGRSSDLSDTDKAQLVTDLKATLQAKLLKQAVDQIPSGFVLFKNGFLLNTNNDSITTTQASDTTITATLNGTLSGFLFEENKLTQKIAASLLPPSTDVTNVYIPNIRNLNFTLPAQAGLSDPTNIGNINFNISGPLKIVWKVDETKLATDMLGQRKSDFNSILSQYPNIDSAQLVIRPFWKTSLPTKPSSIHVIVNYPK